MQIQQTPLPFPQPPRCSTLPWWQIPSTDKLNTSLVDHWNNMLPQTLRQIKGNENVQQLPIWTHVANIYHDLKSLREWWNQFH